MTMTSGRRLLGLLGAALALCVSAPLGALAAGPKFQKGETQVVATQTARTQPKRAKVEGPARPTLQMDAFVRAIEGKVAQIREQQIDKLLQLISATPDNDPEKPDFYFRLAELYADKERFFNFRARELDDPIFRAKGGEKARLEAEQKSYLRQEQEWLLRAVETYVLVANSPKFRTYQKMDHVLFYLAYMLGQVKRQQEARVFFHRLIKDYPTSSFVPYAYLSFAEYYFYLGDMEAALKFYDKVAEFPRSVVYGFAVYKKGWCYYNLSDYRKALEMFKKVIDESQRMTGSKQNRITLEKEAKKDTVRAYAHVGSAERAYAYFQQVGGDYAPKMLELLGDVYNSQGKFGEAIKVFRQLIALFPESHQICTWQNEVVKNTLSAGNKRDQVQELQRLTNVWEKLGTMKGIKQELLDECRSAAADTLRELAVVWHKEAQKTQNADTYGLARYLYKEYLAKFPKERDIYTMTYYYGELLYKLGEQARDATHMKPLFQEAADIYTRVVKMDPKGIYLKDAAYAAVISWRNALEASEERVCREITGPDRLKPQTIPPEQQKMIDAFDTYISYVPQSDKLPDIKYRKARIYYECNHFEQAVPLFTDIATSYKTHELATFSGNLLLDCLGILNRFKELNEWVDKFLATPELAKGEFLAQLQKIKKNSQRKEAEYLEKSGKFKECGLKYDEIAGEYAEAADLPEVLHNASVCFERAKLIGESIRVLQQLVDMLKTRPKEPRAQRALFRLAKAFHDLAVYSKAAEYYELFATKFPGEKEAVGALGNATFFRRGLGEDEKAIANSHLFIKNYGHRNPEQAAAVFFSIAAIYEKNKQWDKFMNHLKEYLRVWGKHGGVDREIEAHVRIGEVLWKQSCPVEGVNGACIKVERVRSGGRAGKAKVAKQCGPETKQRVTVIARKPAQLREAQSHFTSALALFKSRGSKVPGKDEAEKAARTIDMMYAVAQARFSQAEATYESFLAIKFPTDLNFDKRNPRKAEQSTKALVDWLESKGKLLKAASDVYQEVITLKQAHFAIAASARIGQLYQNFADALFTAPVPEYKGEFAEAQRDAYCEALETKAGPLEGKAVEGFDTCLRKSTDLSWYSGWSGLCEMELNQIKPVDYPLASEMRVAPGFVTGRLDEARPVRDAQ